MNNQHPPSDDFMATDDGPLSQEQVNQATQQVSQVESNVGGMDAHLWGFLQPCSPVLNRIDLWKINPTYMFGRSEEGNDIVMPGFKVSNKHCKFIWDGKEDGTSSVLVQDTSSNGTWINGEKIGRGNVHILRDGNEIGFGTSHPQGDKLFEDYRFIFRYVAAGPPKEGLHAFYDIAHELGKGSFATVVRAVLRETGQWFAVKMIHRNKLNRGDATTSATQSFAREISILEKLKHPNICGLREVFFEEANINLVLDLVEGGDLLEYIIKRDGLGEEDAKHITYQICDALAYIHGKGIAHRDLKPENVLLTADNPPIVKVADFGLAKVVDSLTMLRTMCGTPSYLAPEVVMQTNQEGYGHVVDSWSVGVIVYSMLTSANPFIEDTSLDLRSRIAQRSIDWSCLAQANISPQGQHFIKRLLEPTPTLRMTLKDALDHPWLQSYTPIYPHPIPGPDPTEDAAMLSTVSEVAGMQLEPETPGHANRIQREGSRLMRRADVLTRAAEGEGPEVPNPSDEMLYSASQPAAAPSPGPSTRGNKRKVHPVDSKMSEDVNGARKKGRGSSSEGEEEEEGDGDESMSPHRDNGAGRGKGKGRGASTSAPQGRRTRASAAAAAAQGISEDEEGTSAPRTRRATRQSPQNPQKGARRG